MEKKHRRTKITCRMRLFCEAAILKVKSNLDLCSIWFAVFLNIPYAYVNLGPIYRHILAVSSYLS